MATYSKASDYDFDADTDVRCDAHSTFDPEGFPEPGRRWVPLYGAPCVVCGLDDMPASLRA